MSEKILSFSSEADSQAMFAGARKIPETAKFSGEKTRVKRLNPHSVCLPLPPRLPSSGQSKILQVSYERNVQKGSNSDG